MPRRRRFPSGGADGTRRLSSARRDSARGAAIPSVPGPTRTAPAPLATEREALDYLRREVRPLLGHRGQELLQKAVTAAVESGSIDSLGRLAERHRRELLETIDGRLGRGRRAPTPRALVFLTSALAAVPEPPGARPSAIAFPAR